MSFGLKIIKHMTDPKWVARLQKNNYVWLVKEQEMAIVVEPFCGSAPGSIQINRVDSSKDTLLQTWMVFKNGCGFDGSQILLPIEGELLPDTRTHICIT